MNKTQTPSPGALAATALTLLLLLALPPRGQTEDYVWSTMAGKVNENGSTDGKGSDARFKLPEGIAANGCDDAGHVTALVTFTDGKIALVEFTIP